MHSIGQFQSLDNDGGHTIWSAMAESPLLQANFTAYVLYNQCYCRSKFYIVGVRILDLFCSCDPDLDPMSFIYKPDPYSFEMCHVRKNELSTSRLSRVIVWQTYIQTDTTKIKYHSNWQHFTEVLQRCADQWFAFDDHLVLLLVWTNLNNWFEQQFVDDRSANYSNLLVNEK